MKQFLFTIALLIVSAYFAQAQTGTLTGTVLEQDSEVPVMFGNVTLMGTTIGTSTDMDGHYTLSAPAGVYEVQFSYVGFTDALISEVEIIADQVATLNSTLAPKSDVLETVVVTASQLTNTETAMATMQRKSTNLINAVSSATFKKVGDSDAAGAVKRVTGVSIQGGKYVYVRGLGDRYTKSLLNGMDIPGLDPDRNTLQMDIFPTNVIDNIVVVKSFTADLPADFTGGVVDIATKSYPEQKSSSIDLGLSYNPKMHFKSDYVDYKGSGTDWLGFDNGQRDIPTGNASSYIPSRAGALGDAQIRSDYIDILRKFNPIMSAEQHTSLMNYNVGFSMGNLIEKPTTSIGYNFAFTYKNNTEFFDDARYERWGRGNTSDILELDRRESQVGQLGINNVLASVMGGAALVTDKSKHIINLMHLQNGERRSGIFNYVGSDQGSNFSADQYNLEYSQRSVTNMLINGQYDMGKTKDWTLDWRLSPTLSKITDPDIRVSRIRTDDNSFSIGTESGIPERIWRYLNEVTLAGKVDLTKEYKIRDRGAKVKFGTDYTYKHRDYEIRNFFIYPNSNADYSGEHAANTFFDENNLFSDENINGTYYDAQFVPNNPNKYEGRTSNIAGYVSNEAKIAERFNTIIGLRMEYYTQYYTGQNQQNTINLNNQKVLDDVGFFPSVNMIYSVANKQNLRASYSRTTARPSFKEASYASIIDPISGRTFIGGFVEDKDAFTNTVFWDGNLTNTDINNFDLRWELFSEGGQMFSIGGFAKTFKNPIEMVQYAQAVNNFQPRNVGDGMVFGGELELIQDLDFITKSLKNLRFNVNLTVVNSSIKMSSTEYNSRLANARDGQSIKDTRQMAGQAPYLVNAGLAYQDADRTYNIGLFYNVQGKTLQYVGVNDRPDVYSKPFHSLDFNAGYKFGHDKKMSLGLKVSNIIGSKRESVFESFGANDQLFSSLRPSTTIGLSYSYRLF